LLNILHTFLYSHAAERIIHATVAEKKDFLEPVAGPLRVINSAAAPSI
jgi:hypothetical protein